MRNSFQNLTGNTEFSANAEFFQRQFLHILSNHPSEYGIFKLKNSASSPEHEVQEFCHEEVQN